MQKSSIISAGRAALPRSLARSRPPLDIIVALLIVYVIWGSTYLAIRIALEGFPPFLMAAARFLIAGAVLYAILRLRGTPNPTRAQWRGAGLVGALLLLGGNGGVTFAEQWIPSGVAALAVATVPVWTAIFAVIWGQRPGRLEWLGVGVGFVGVVLLNFDGNMQANPFGAAVVLLLATACPGGGGNAVPATPRAQTRETGGTLDVLMHADFEHLDPARNYLAEGLDFGRLL
ncbi:MAG: hypothetical protein DLM65_10845, partial [Candidatus Aeolococcus gillhamiae]